MIFGRKGSSSSKKSPYSDAAFMRGFIEGLVGEGGQAQASPQGQTVNTQRANQQGGMASPQQGGQAASAGYGDSKDGKGGVWSDWIKPNLGLIGGAVGGPLGGLLGGAIAGGGSSQAATTPQTAAMSINPELMASIERQRQAFEAYQQQALAGQQGLPQGYQQDVMARGVGNLAAQAAQQQNMLMQALAGRGMLRSGAEERGRRDIAAARTGGIADLSSQLMQQDVAARLQAQQGAAGMYIDQLRAALGAGMQEQQLGLQREMFAEQQKQAVFQDIAAIMAGLYPKPEAALPPVLGSMQYEAPGFAGYDKPRSAGWRF